MWNQGSLLTEAPVLPKLETSDDLPDDDNNNTIREIRNSIITSPTYRLKFPECRFDRLGDGSSNNS
eukprot:4858011-Prymnesium_polylepis.1